MASAQSAYDFSLFEPYDYGSSAPALKPDKEPSELVKFPSKVPVKQNGKKITASQKRAAYASSFSALKVIACVFCIFSAICAAMYLNVKLDETANMILETESGIKIAKSENVRLNSILEGMVSVDKVDAYAENNLGMVKLENYKIKYFESQEGNHVVVSGGRSYAGEPIKEKLHNLTEYIFDK